jgi:hypothetical protein
MKVRVKRWHGVAIWKWDIADEEACFQFEEKVFNLECCRFVVYAECLTKPAVPE